MVSSSLARRGAKQFDPGADCHVAVRPFLVFDRWREAFATLLSCHAWGVRSEPVDFAAICGSGGPSAS